MMILPATFGTLHPTGSDAFVKTQAEGTAIFSHPDTSRITPGEELIGGTDWVAALGIYVAQAPLPAPAPLAPIV